MSSKIIFGVIIVVIIIGIIAVLSLDYTTNEPSDIIEDTTPVELPPLQNGTNYYINEDGQKTFVIDVTDSPSIGG